MNVNTVLDFQRACFKHYLNDIQEEIPEFPKPYVYPDGNPVRPVIPVQNYPKRIMLIGAFPSARFERRDGKPYRIGREAVVFIVRATTGIKECSEEEREVYKDGTTLWWKWQAKTSLEEYGFSPRQIVCKVLGYNPNYNFRGFGKQHSGLLPLDKTQFDLLYRRFRHRF